MTSLSRFGYASLVEDFLLVKAGGEACIEGDGLGRIDLILDFSMVV